MSKQFLTAQQTPTGLNFTAWLDTSKTLADGTPDPAWVQSYTWGAQPDGWTGATLNGTAYTTWAEYVTAEVQLLAQAAYDALTADPAPLAVQGQTFN